LAIAAFAFWGVISRATHLPAPVLLTIVCVTGAITCACAERARIKWSVGAAFVGLILSADLFLLILAFQKVDFATVVALHNAGALFVIVLAPRLASDAFRPKALGLAAIGVAAVAVICGVKLVRYSPEELKGVGLALLSAGTLAANILAQRRLMKTGISHRSAVLQYNIVLTAVYAAISLLSIRTGLHVDLRWPNSGKDVILAAAAGVITQGFAMMFFNSAARRLASETMARLSLIGPAITVGTGFLFYSQRPSWIQILALLVILAVSQVQLSPEPSARDAFVVDDRSETRFL
jgi:drug/metabolite transporter (DMT)-like permease